MTNAFAKIPSVDALTAFTNHRLSAKQIDQYADKTILAGFLISKWKVEYFGSL